MCACAAGAALAVSTAGAAERPALVELPDALVPLNSERLVPPSEQPSRELQRTYLRLHRKVGEQGERPGRNIVRHGVAEPDGSARLATGREVARSVRVLRRKVGPGATSPQLQKIAACESGGNPRAVGGGGAYRGKYQFSYGTWASVGGSGDPAAAPEAEQDRRAAMLLARDGAGHWPNCG